MAFRDQHDKIRPGCPKRTGRQPACPRAVHGSRWAGRGPAFSLIELLVVVSIMTLLIGLLLPVLSRARSAARKAGCLSNMRQLGVALEAFFSDHSDEMPFGEPAQPTFHRGYTFGGRMPRADSLLRGGTYNAPPPYARPLNQYVHERKLLGDRDSPEEELDQIDLPVFHCPADDEFNYQEDFWAEKARFTMSNHDAAGTSYSFNVMWQENTDYFGRPEKAARKMHQMRTEQPSQFSPIMDDPAEWALWARRMNSIPHHGADSSHIFLFFDGHADYLKVNPHDRYTVDYRVVFDDEDS